MPRINTFVATLLATGAMALPAMAQTLDVFSLGGADMTIMRNADTGQQELMSGDGVLLTAPAITRDLTIIDQQGNDAGFILYVQGEEEGCAPTPYVVSVQFGLPWPQGPIGTACVPYLATARAGTAVFLSAPDLGQNGDAVVFNLEQGIVPLGPIVYAPIPDRGWDALDGEVGGYNDLSPLDLYTAQPVYDALKSLWGDELFIYARHLASRTVPIIDGNFLLQSGCLPGQCAFTLGLLAVDAANEEVFSAYFNEGAPDVRPPLEEWSDPARAIFERWRAGEFQ